MASFYFFPISSVVDTDDSLFFLDFTRHGVPGNALTSKHLSNVFITFLASEFAMVSSKVITITTI